MSISSALKLTVKLDTATKLKKSAGWSGRNSLLDVAPLHYPNGWGDDRDFLALSLSSSGLLFALDPNARLKDLQIGCPYDLELLATLDGGETSKESPRAMLSPVAGALWEREGQGGVRQYRSWGLMPGSAYQEVACFPITSEHCQL